MNVIPSGCALAAGANLPALRDFVSGALMSSTYLCFLLFVDFLHEISGLKPKLLHGFITKDPRFLNEKFGFLIACLM
jgi:hypothetical protein